MAIEFRGGLRSASRWRRAAYRGRQFFQALLAPAQLLSAGEVAEVRACLPAGAWSLFAGMAPSDQRHSLYVLRTLQQQGQANRALWQAALLHDCAKHGGGVRLWHRVAVVLLAAFFPAWLARWTQASAPPRASWRYPFWTHVHHPACGAALAAAAGCEPLAVRLIAHHQDHPAAGTGDPDVDFWLPALQAADDDN